jgi:Dis3-like cold-shock domain 2 (CSD2)/Rrp44-like cold shock domain
MAMASHRTATCSTRLEEEPWVSRSFLKDAKLRTTERYFRDPNDLLVRCSLPPLPAAVVAVRIIPDARTWRKYLRLIRTLVTEYHDVLPVQWFLTESAVELMDYRNQSVPEAAAPQERTVLQRLLHENNHVVIALADLTVHDDEWDFMHYETMTITQRSRHAHVRAACLLTNHQSRKEEAAAPCCCYWLLVDNDDETNNLLPLDDEDDQNIKYVHIQDLIDNLAKYLSSSDHVDRLEQLQHACEIEYQQRNAPPTTAGDIHELANTNFTPEEIPELLKRGILLRGRLNVTKENVREAYVTTTTAGTQTTYFVDHEHINHAMHQDVVIIEALPESQWGRPVGKRRLVHHTTAGNDDEDAGDVALDYSVTTVPAVPSARVVCVDQPGRRIYVATMIDMPNSDEGRAVLVVPMDLRIPKIRVRTRTWRQRFEGQRLKVEITGWETGSNYPTGHCMEVLGPIGEMEVEIKALLIENQVDLEPFSAKALACLPVEGSAWRVSDEDIQKRRDLRQSRRVFSVDPPGCQDIDDTMHAEILPNGDIEGKAYGFWLLARHRLLINTFYFFL